MRVCLIQDTNNEVGKAGAVAPGITAEYAREAETITLGFAPGKSYDSVGIGRHGNFMLWGWSASPSKMTPAGQKLFLNCICYIHQYDNKPFTRIPQHTMIRGMSSVLFNSMQRRPARAGDYLSRYFPSDIAKKYENDLPGMRKYYEANVELVYVTQRKFCIDDDLKSLGIDSNRNIATIETLIDLLDEKTKAELAQDCLRRYTKQSFDSVQAWRQWFEENEEHLIFSDAGGYRFYRVPELK